MSTEPKTKWDVLFSSATENHATPRDLAAKLVEQYKIERDVCADASNAIVPVYWTKKDDALSKTWTGVCYMNPPYGTGEKACKANCKKKKCEKRGFHCTKDVPGIGDWVKKAYESTLVPFASPPVTVVCLLPARTDTAWFHQYVLPVIDDPGRRGSYEFIRGRLRFGDADNSAPFPSLLVVFRSIHAVR